MDTPIFFKPFFYLDVDTGTDDLSRISCSKPLLESLRPSRSESESGTSSAIWGACDIRRVFSGAWSSNGMMLYRRRSSRMPVPGRPGAVDCWVGCGLTPSLDEDGVGTGGRISFSSELDAGSCVAIGSPHVTRPDLEAGWLLA